MKYWNEIIRPKKEEVFELVGGDILFDSGKFCIAATKEDWGWEGEETTPWINLFAFNRQMNPWRVLIDMGIDCHTAYRAAKYEDVYLGHEYVGLLPRAIRTADVRQYKNGILEHCQKVDSYDDIAYDWSFWQRASSPNPFAINRGHLPQLMMGSGHTEMCSIHDGSSSLQQMTMLLSNGDRILSWGWVWHNK